MAVRRVVVLEGEQGKLEVSLEKDGRYVFQFFISSVGPTANSEIPKPAPQVELRNTNVVRPFKTKKRAQR